MTKNRHTSTLFGSRKGGILTVTTPIKLRHCIDTLLYNMLVKVKKLDGQKDEFQFDENDTVASVRRPIPMFSRFRGDVSACSVDVMILSDN